MTMKKLAIATLFLLTTSLLTLAQPGPGGPPPEGKKRERIEAMKIGFITDQLQLTPTEAQAFWPVYNQYQDELEKLRKSRKENLLNARANFDELSDSDVEKLVDNEIAFRQSELDLVKKYNPQFKKVLPMKKVGKLYRAEEEFKRELLNKLQDKRDDNRKSGKRPGPPPGGPR